MGEKETAASASAERSTVQDFEKNTERGRLSLAEDKLADAPEEGRLSANVTVERQTPRRDFGD